MPQPPETATQSPPPPEQIPPAAAPPPEPGKRIRRTVTTAALAARRRNAQKNTGPRTAAGKRRSALNSLQRHLCPAWFEPILLRQGGDRAGFLRLHRDLIALLRPFDDETRRMVEFLAVCWWDKSRRLRALQLPTPSRRAAAAKAEPGANDIAIRRVLTLLYQANYRKGHRWLARLSYALGSVPPNAEALRRQIEARLGLAGRRPRRRTPQAFPPDLQAELMELLERATDSDAASAPDPESTALPAGDVVRPGGRVAASKGWLRALWLKVSARGSVREQNENETVAG